ncbi:MAG: DUF3098 domain-containing protein [Bacteroidetes bacterium]|nr:DUF3098 domain-containing protein [Bacteroidota bacterium]MBK7110100.1 DUF3098 domain-containing protein [Bacteroidota bacterium]MBK8487174.1 DUF3098 domain-containing protein [Bacteroidota bacterium]MBK8680560.1 DUF3098 domain-containing protein [Bacteroidota bacterium]
MEIKNQPIKNVSQEEGMVLGKMNYYLILLGVVVIVIGFILMSGGKYTDPNVFNGDELYSTRRITIAPIVVLLGFAIEIFAIFYKQKK